MFGRWFIKVIPVNTTNKIAQNKLKWQQRLKIVNIIDFLYWPKKFPQCLPNNTFCSHKPFEPLINIYQIPISFFKKIFCVCVCIWKSGQSVGAVSLLPCGTQGSNSGSQPWWLVALPTEPCHWPISFLLICLAWLSSLTT